MSLEIPLVSSFASPDEVVEAKIKLAFLAKSFGSFTGLLGM